MTSYQNVAESQIQGYNDCPVLDYTKRSTSSSSLASRNRRRALMHQSSTSNLSDVTNRIPSGSSPLLAPKRTSSRVSSVNSLPPRREEDEISITCATDVNASDIIAEDDTVSKQEILEKLNHLLNLPSNLPSIEFNHYSKRLKDTISKDSFKQDYEKVILKCLNDVNNNETKITVDYLIKFMLSNDGTSVWGQPFKKIIENVQQ